MKIWDLNSGNELATLVSIDSTNWVVTTPDGRFDGSEGGMKQLYYVKGLKVIPLDALFEKYYTPNLLTRVMSGEQIEKSEINLAELKSPPLVRITSPENNSKITTEQLTVTVEVTDQGGGIDEILLYHNGKLVQTTNRGFKLVEQKDTKSVKTFTITLTNGENKIKATAFNTQRTEAIPDEITVNYQGTVATSNLYMLVIGIDKYKNPKYCLNYAVADASGFKTVLETGAKSIFGSVNITFLDNEKATRAGILEAISAIKSSIKQSDVFVFYYAGHGVMSEETKSKYYLIPYDVTQLYGDNKMLQSLAISSDEMQTFATEIKAQKQMYIFDACQSGGMVEALASRGAAEEKAIAQLARSTGTYWLAASGSQQFSTEFAELGHGIFTYTLLLGFKGEADGQPLDKKITAEEIGTFVKNKLPDLSEKYKGSAQYPNSYGYGTDFPIIIVK